MKSPEELTRIFRERGLKVTPQRQSIFRVLHGTGTHPTAEAVHAEVSAGMPTISLRAVYQTLNDLAAMGEIQAIDVGTGSVRFDPHVEEHHHLVCERCGRVQDLDADFPGVTLPADNPFGFRVTATEIVFRGLCRECVALPSGDDAAPSAQAMHTQNEEARRA